MDAVEQARLIAADTLAQADKRSEDRVVAAVDAVMTNVVLHVGMAEKTLLERIDGVKSTFRWQIIAGLVGGQSAAAVLAAYVTGKGEKVEQAVSAILPFV